MVNQISNWMYCIKLEISHEIVKCASKDGFKLKLILSRLEMKAIPHLGECMKIIFGVEKKKNIFTF